ncbi:MAG TPA: hypothetical protein DIU07_07080 [Rhodobacteraceae bacterium]|nr:hypothetical protein [Paracoccaceae bacterium]
MERSSWIFIAGSLVATVLVSWIAFPFAAMDRDVVERAAAPQPAEALGTVDVGQGFGELPVEELMLYYVENPPAAPQAGAVAAPEIKFGGC